MKIYEKLSTIQMELKAPKGQFNSFGKYKYRSCEDIQESVKPLLNANKCVLIISDTLEQQGERYYIKATATIYDTETGEKVENTAFAREEETKKGMDGSQITGATSSYARKYALNGLFCIDDTKDSDATNTHDKEQPKGDFNNISNVEDAKKAAAEALKKADEKSYACVDCGNPFVEMTIGDKTYSPKEIYEGSIKKNGKAICRHCKELKKGETK